MPSQVYQDREPEYVEHDYSLNEVSDHFDYGNQVCQDYEESLN